MTAPQIVPTQSNAQAAMAAFLASILPPDVVVVTAQQNRIAEPRSPTFIVMTPIRFTRLRTNVETTADVRLVGGISGTLLTIAEVTIGTFGGVGSQLFGSGVSANTVVANVGPAPNQWIVTPAQNVSAGTVMSAGATVIEQGAELTIQLDVHSADTSRAGDIAQTISTIFRSPYAVDQFATSGFDITPFYADDPRMAPFINDQQQWEWRWVVESRMQVNDVVSLPLQYADSLVADLISVDATYPP